MNTYITLNELNSYQNTKVSNLLSYVDIFNTNFSVTGLMLPTLLLLDHGDRYLSIPITDDDVADSFSAYADKILTICYNMYIAKMQYRYTNLIETMFYDYNPIWNVDGTTVTETERNQTETKTHKNNQAMVISQNLKQGQTVTQTTTRGQTITNTETADSAYNYDELSYTNRQDTDTTTYGKTTTHNVAPYNSTTTKTEYADTDSDSDSTTHEKTGTETTKHGINKSNVTSFGEGNDTVTTTTEPTNTTSDNTTTTTYTGNGDTDTTAYTGDPDTVTETRQGNIGVTSTQSLIKQQREIVDFDIIGKFINEIATYICLGVYIKP